MDNLDRDSIVIGSPLAVRLGGKEIAPVVGSVYFVFDFEGTGVHIYFGLAYNTFESLVEWYADVFHETENGLEIRYERVDRPRHRLEIDVPGHGHKIRTFIFYAVTQCGHASQAFSEDDISVIPLTFEAHKTAGLDSYGIIVEADGK